MSYLTQVKLCIYSSGVTYAAQDRPDKPKGVIVLVWPGSISSRMVGKGE